MTLLGLLGNLKAGAIEGVVIYLDTANDDIVRGYFEKMLRALATKTGLQKNRQHRLAILLETAAHTLRCELEEEAASKP